MLQVSGIRKAFGPQVLFEEATFHLEPGDRAALVGPNGAGKSTLFSLVLGEDEPDEGQVVREKGLRLGHLPQETAPLGEETVLEIAVGVTPEHAALRARIGAAERAGQLDADYHEAVSRYTELGGYETEPRAKRILSGLAFRETDYDRPAGELSGGWVMRAHLARLLTAEPDLLLLDEPTNHLDLESLRWFQDHLRGYRGTLLLVSHDRAFLNAVVGKILEVRHHRLHTYRGNYDDYLEESAARDAQQLASYRAQQKKIEQLERFVARFGAKATKAAQAKSKQKQLDRMERIEPPAGAEKTVRIRFPQPPPSGQKVIALEQVHFAYGAHPVYRGIDFTAEKGQRLVLIGPNGAGKSTLLKLLAGVLAPDAGTRTLGHQVRSGYFSQSRIDMLDPARTVLEEVMAIGNPVPEQTARTVLGSFLFRGDAVHKKVAVLSGGEKSRLGLVKLLLDPPNLLLMDEPTTHLDMASIDALVEALGDYPGTLLFISHDVYFIRRIARSVLHVDAGRLTAFAGDYDAYLHQQEARDARSALTESRAPGDARPPDGRVSRDHRADRADRSPSPAASAAGPKTREQKRQEAAARRARAERRREVERLEQAIIALEEEQAALTRQLEDPDLYDSDPGRVMELNREVVATNDRLEELNHAWLSASERLETA